MVGGKGTGASTSTGLRAALLSGRLPGRRRSALVPLALLLACTEPTAPRDEGPGAAFDRFWLDFDRTYSYFDYKRIDWEAVQPQFRDRAAAAATDSALVDVLREAVQPLRDVHVWFRNPGGATLASYTPSRPRNWVQANWLNYLPRLGWRQGVSNWGWGRRGDVGYLAIGAWNTSQVRIEDVDAALEQLRDTRTLVLDVRMNGGGNDALALQLAGRFAAARRRFGAVRTRNGPEHTDFGPWVDRFLEPRGSWQYEQPVYLLVGAGCFSSNETFIAALGELAHVTIVGDTTGGSSGNPQEFALRAGARDTGWKYSVPRWIEVLADGTVVEWNGIAPDLVVPFDAATVAAGRDPVLEWAFARAGVTLTTSAVRPAREAEGVRRLLLPQRR